MNGDKKANAASQERFRKTMREAGRKQLNMWIAADAKTQFNRIKDLLQCNSNDAFERLMLTVISDLTDDELIEKLKGR